MGKEGGKWTRVVREMKKVEEGLGPLLLNALKNAFGLSMDKCKKKPYLSPLKYGKHFFFCLSLNV
jgi:hypothetical protein